MRLAHILAELHQKPWLITAPAYRAVAKLVHDKLLRAGPADQRAGDVDWVKEYYPQRREFKVDENGIAHIHVFGVLARGLSKVERACGNTDLFDIERECDQALQRAAGLMLWVDSPGGCVNGTPEAAAIIAQVEQKIPVVAYCPGLMASAAYYLASQASEIWATESAQVGSIGVIIPWIDEQGWWDEMGIAADPITNEGADLKATMYRPRLTDAEREHLQQLVDDSAASFHDAVRLGRGELSPEMLRGQCMAAPRALEGRLIDAIGTEAQAYASMLSLAGV